jgi:hypothetical protein
MSYAQVSFHVAGITGMATMPGFIPIFEGTFEVTLVKMNLSRL